MLVRADQPGPDLPPVGRSLFDFLIAEDTGGVVPFPFEALLATIEPRLKQTLTARLKTVLIPLGRSLHRDAAQPDFFAFPRVIAAAEAEPAPEQPAPLILLKDRFYLGYQEKAESIEVISYNEAAGRFEFQVVKDYRAGSTPRITYADRGLCLGCHQNHGPIFAREPWAETNSNPKIAALLRQRQDSFHGIPAFRGVDIPGLIDQSVDRGGLLLGHQIFWRQGCAGSDDAIACRADALLAILRFRLAGDRHARAIGDGRKRDLAARLLDGWRRNWPQGLAVAGAKIADWDPFGHARYGGGTTSPDQALKELIDLTPERLVLYDEQLEPLYPRPPREIWRAPPPGLSPPPANAPWLERLIAGLGGFVTDADLAVLDAGLVAAGAGAPERRYRAACTLTTTALEAGARRIDFDCQSADRADRADRGDALEATGRIVLDGDRLRRAGIDRMQLGDTDPVRGLDVAGAEIVRGDGLVRLTLTPVPGPDPVPGLDPGIGASRLNARLTNGERVHSLTLQWPEGDHGAAAAEAVLRLDLAPLVDAVAALAEATRAGHSDALAEAPFRRVGTDFRPARPGS